MRSTKSQKASVLHYSIDWVMFVVGHYYLVKVATFMSDSLILVFVLRKQEKGKTLAIWWAC